jgi:hypothetical protein
MISWSTPNVRQSTEYGIVQQRDFDEPASKLRGGFKDLNEPDILLGTIEGDRGINQVRVHFKIVLSVFTTL